MSVTNVNEELEIVQVGLAEIGVINDMNTCREGDGYFNSSVDFGEMILDLAPKWDASLGFIKAIRVDRYDEMKKIKDGWAAKAQAERKATYQNLLNSKEQAKCVLLATKEGEEPRKETLDAKDVAEVYLATYFEGGNPEKPIAPTYLVNNCFRRMYCIPWVKTLAKREGVKGVTDYTTLPMQVVDFADEFERVQANYRENTHKTRGARPVSVLNLVAGWMLNLKKGMLPAQVGKLMNVKHGTGQKYTRLAKLIQAFPREKLWNLLLETKDENGRCKAPALIRLYDKEVLEDLRLGAIVKDPVTGRESRPGTLASIEKVKAYLLNPKGTEGNKPKSAKRTEMESLSESSGIVIVKLVLKAVLDNNLAIIEQLLGDHEDAINAATPKAVDEYLAEAVETAEAE